jgi:peptide-methionine (S)-S-oxide reductase
VSAIDSGDLSALGRQLAAHPCLVRERLESPGAWLRDVVGNAIQPDGFFERPYLLWFVAEDPVRNGKLPGNIADVANLIIQAARREKAENLQEQIAYALRLVCWSWIARDCGVQISLVDVLLDAGASPDGLDVYQGRFGSHCDAAIFNGNFDAAQHLIARGAPVTLTTALCVGRWDDVERLARNATLAEMQDAFVMAALQGRADALRRMLALGVDATTISARNFSHGTALHHAVWSGCLEAVNVLVEAGADLTRRDMIYDGTPLGWAIYAERENAKSRGKQYAEIAAYLREHGGQT